MGLRRTADSGDRLAGASRAVRRFKDILGSRRGAFRVLREGESGTGKGVMAGLLHNRSPRSSAPFVDLNCTGRSMEVLEA